MRRLLEHLLALLALLPLLIVCAAARPASACGATMLEVGVRDLQDAPVAGVAFDLDIAGTPRTATTDATGTVTVSCLEANQVRIVAARRADGTKLLMDENAAAGGLTIPLLADQTQRLPLRLSDSLLFVEPVAEPDQSSVFAPTVTPPPAAAAVVTSPIPRASRPAWVWGAVALILGAPILLGAAMWLRSARATRRRDR
jgi:hypothetical protein